MTRDVNVSSFHAASAIWFAFEVQRADLTNGLIAAYCRLVAQASGLTDAQRWNRMYRFVQVLQQQLAANDLPPGSTIIVEVPVPPAVYSQLRSQAKAAG